MPWPGGVTSAFAEGLVLAFVDLFHLALRRQALEAQEPVALPRLDAMRANAGHPFSQLVAVGRVEPLRPLPHLFGFLVHALLLGRLLPRLVGGRNHRRLRLLIASHSR